MVYVLVIIQGKPNIIESLEKRILTFVADTIKHSTNSLLYICTVSHLRSLFKGIRVNNGNNNRI
jgi:hypothetical protein